MDIGMDSAADDTGAGPADKASRKVVRRPRVKPDMEEEAHRIAEQRERCQLALMDYQAP